VPPSRIDLVPVEINITGARINPTRTRFNWIRDQSNSVQPSLNWDRAGIDLPLFQLSLIRTNINSTRTKSLPDRTKSNSIKGKSNSIAIQKGRVKAVSVRRPNRDPVSSGRRPSALGETKQKPDCEGGLWLRKIPRQETSRSDGAGSRETSAIPYSCFCLECHHPGMLIQPALAILIRSLPLPVR